jgi:hypothetical protein
MPAGPELTGRRPTAPPVLIVGGFLSSPPVYWAMRRRLLARGTCGVWIAPVWTPDWLISSRIGLGPLARRTGRAIVRAYREGGRVPVMVVGHSAGGVLARLAMSPEPFQGYGAAVADAVGGLVTLGTPHHVAGEPPPGNRRAGHDASHFLDAVSPGAAFAPRTGYVSVASRFVPGGPADDPERRRRMAGSSYAWVLDEHARKGFGDGLIPVESALLEGTTQLLLDDVGHSQGVGTPWYGDDRGIEQWWPTAVRTWREALAVRASERDISSSA